MNLTAKGASAIVPPTVNTLQVNLTWTSGVDFDLMVVAKNAAGEYQPFYFGNKSGPGIQLGGDAGVGDTAGSNSESATITEFGANWEDAVLCILDYNKASAGETGRFDTDTPEVTITGYGDDYAEIVKHTATPNGGMLDGNVCAIGRLTKAGPIVKFELLGESSVLKSFSGAELQAFASSLM